MVSNRMAPGCAEKARLPRKPNRQQSCNHTIIDRSGKILPTVAAFETTPLLTNCSPEACHASGTPRYFDPVWLKVIRMYGVLRTEEFPVVAGLGRGFLGARTLIFRPNLSPPVPSTLIILQPTHHR
ncbi:uncharacterized protein BO80DRAFT_207420 [Aspergillus ibericus CBS 121593]|uniref:Uncharacterized protein n=1 Tax=Aspergillus ibericus CBS 121593 TaxID=1448316 RepID=A0A395HAL2_9EURO|nr:hypothetical protein BO80DRAFT_207420 [Aspergillus ibericus CBS 121593]RAL04730.1 hypothetical protein BO80DRAFT_207420 [Aspergillus ibericus CBS 121593]